MVKRKKGLKKIRRRCLVCGTSITINRFSDGHYHGAHFFGDMKIPIGKGEYKKTGSFKIGKTNHDVVKWTGKEKTVEYWECDACYKTAGHLIWLEENIERLFGERCPDSENGCPCCDAWSVYDIIREFGEASDLKKRKKRPKTDKSIHKS